MFSSVRRLIGAIRVYEKGDLVYVEGISTFSLMNTIYKIWNTSKIANNMFTHIDSSSLSFNKFFVPDFIYALKIMLEFERKKISVRAVVKTIELLKQNTWFKVSEQSVVPYFKRENLKNLVYDPLKHQLEFLDRCEINMLRFQLHGYLLAASPGLGKTFMCLMTGEVLETDVNIVIVPKNSLDLVWKKSFAELYKNKVPYWTTSMGTQPPMGLRNYAFHYERLDEAISFVSKNKFVKPLIWLDESHNLNEMSSQRSQLFSELVKVSKSKLVFWASGTPIKAMGREVIPLLRSIDPHFNQDAEERFTEIFGKSASRALDILNHRIGMVMHQTTKAEIKSQKPITKEVKVKIPNGKTYTLDNVRSVIKDFVKERTEYYNKNKKTYVAAYELGVNLFEKTLKTREQKIELSKYKSYIKIISSGYDPKVHKALAMFCNHYELKVISQVLSPEIRDAFRNARTVVKYCHMKILGEALGRVLGKMREQCIVDLVPHADLPSFIDEAEKKVLIFSTFVSAIKTGADFLTKEGYQPLLVYGDTNKDLKGIVTKFGENEDINPLLATFASLSTAVPLTMANVCITLNTPFRPYIYEQAISRIDRLGQDTQVYIFNLYLNTGEEQNLSTRAGDILEWCRDQIEQIIGKSVTLEEGESVSMECFDNVEFHRTNKSIQTTWSQW